MAGDLASLKQTAFKGWKLQRHLKHEVILHWVFNLLYQYQLVTTVYDGIFKPGPDLVDRFAY
jgi:hypothetical protein